MYKTQPFYKYIVYNIINQPYNMQNQLKIKENFYLGQTVINTFAPEVEVSKPVNHYVVIDISGSMYGSLQYIRTQLKNKLSTLLKEKDTITLIYFSGYNEAGIIKEEVEIRSLKTLQDLHTAIDRWLTPLGLTSFSKPLELVGEAIERISKNRPDSLHSLFFMSDGGENSGPRSETLIALKALAPILASSVYVEFGYYADSKRLTDMAEITGGEKILAEDFDEYDVVFSDKLSQSLSSSKKLLVSIPKEYRKFDFAFTLNANKDILVYAINEVDSSILVPEDIQFVYYFMGQDLQAPELDFENPHTIEALYTSIYVLSDKLKVQDAEDIFGVLGDKHTFDIFVNAYGKQKLNAFKSLVKDCITDETLRFQEGRVDNLVVDEHAYCLMTCIQDLQAFSENKFYPGHEAFKYNRIGQKKVQKSMSEFSAEDKERLATITDIAELKSVVEELTAKYQDFELKFVTTDPNKGYELSELVWNSSRANLSVQVTYHGTVALPENKFGLESIETVMFRNYTILKDGILNIKELPISLNKHTYNILQTYNLIEGNEAWKEDRIFVLNLSTLPVVNRSMTQSISALNLAGLEWQLLQDKGTNKVYKYYENKLFASKSEGYIEKYGEECAVWLNSLGLSEGNGFSPKTETQESTDFYMSVNLETKIAGCSSIPKIEDVIPKVEKLLEIESKLQEPDADSDKLLAEKSKLFKVSETLLVPAIKEYLTQTSSKLYLSQKPEMQLEILKTWIKDAKDQANKNRRKLLQNIAQIKFGLILSKQWLREFKSMEENELEVELIKGEKPFKVKFELSEKQEKI